MKVALDAFLARYGRDADGLAAVVAAAEAVAAHPWDVVRQAGLLARCTTTVSDKDIGLTALLRVTGPDHPHAVTIVGAGTPFPTLAHPGRRSRGAFDTPVEMARRVVSFAMAASETRPRTGLDAACGTGAFLVAMDEAGVEEIQGSDLDETALAVARIACPRAKLSVADGLHGGPSVDLVVGNPPFVPPERQDKALRAELRRRFPWLHGRFDLVIPFAAVAVDRCRSGGIVGLVLPAPAMVQPYGAVLRRRWVERHRIVEIAGPQPFPGASVDVVLLVMHTDAGPKPLPAYGMTPEELLKLDAVPLNPDLVPGDIDLVLRIREVSIPLGELALVDTGLVAHGPSGGRERLLHDEPGPGRVPYADARDFFAGRIRWLEYDPPQMHRPKRPELFEGKKIVIQRLRGDGIVRAAIDDQGVYVGHTCTVVLPKADAPPIQRLLDLVKSPLVDGIVRIERGERLDLYPRDVASFPVPKKWLDNPAIAPEKAWGIGAREVAQLMRYARR